MRVAGKRTESALDIQFYEVFSEEREALLRYLPANIRAGFSKETIQLDSRLRPPARLVSIRTQSIVPSAWFGKLSGILTRSSGYDHLLFLRMHPGKRPALGYLPSYCERAVAEHALTLLLALAKRLRRQVRQFETFNRDGLTGTECLGRRLLVVGVGRIGKEVVRLAKGVGMEVRGVDVVRRVSALKYVSLKEGIRFAEMIVCALPLTRATRGLLGYGALRHAKGGTLFVNVSRGEISPIRDLKRLLDQGLLGGIGLDAYEEEGRLGDALRTKKRNLPRSGRILLSLKEDDRVLFTPHNAFNTEETVARKAQKSVAAVVRFLGKGTFPYPVP